MPVIVIDVIKRFGGYALAALVVLAAYLWAHHAVYQNGYKDGEQKVQAAWDSDKAKHSAAAVIAISDAKADSDSNSRNAIAAAVKQGNDTQTVDANFKVIEERVKSYAKNHEKASVGSGNTGDGSHVGAAGLDADGLRIWNAANAGSASADAGAPGQHPQ
jgi:hypothetical protein